MPRNSGLGKGLAALIPSDSSDSSSDPLLQDIDITHVVPNRLQPRAHFNEETLAELAASITAVGVIQPIVVREVDEGYEILAGERRWRAAKKAGLTKIPAFVRTADDRDSLEVALIENIQRENLNPLEEAAAYRQLTDDFGLTQNQVAKRVGRSRSAVTNTIRLLTLPTTVQELIIDGKLTAGHGRALLTLKGDAARHELAEIILKEGLTVREAERRAATTRKTDGESESSTSKGGESEESSVTQAGIFELEELLATRLTARVKVKLAPDQSTGRITIQFSDLSDLERIYNVITPPGTVL